MPYLIGDALEVLRTMDDESVQMCVTSPPYWGLRTYGADGQYGLEPTPEEHIAKMVEVFREVRRVLRKDGTLWLNYGDSYAGGGGYSPGSPSNQKGHYSDSDGIKEYCGLGRSEKGIKPIGILKPKDLCFIPHRVAMALQADGWWVRQDIVWSKPNPMPESVTDRPTRSHEYIFLMSKSLRYFYDADAVREPSQKRAPGNRTHQKRTDSSDFRDTSAGHKKGGILDYLCENEQYVPVGRNLRSVWEIPTHPFSGWLLDFENADYVGDDGKPYKVSEDCPTHGHLYDCQKDETLSGGEQQDRHHSRKSDNPNYHDQEPEPESVSILSHESNRKEISNKDEHTVQSNASNKTSGFLNMAESQNHQDIADTERKSACNLDSASLDNSGFAKEHNTQNRKMGRVHETNFPCSPSEETPFHTDDKQGLHGMVDSAGHTFENNNGEDSGEDEKEPCPSVQTLFDISDKSLYSPQPIKQSDSGIVPKCTCKISRMSHFATFPPKLVKRCILAGTSHKACEICGAPWERVVEQERPETRSVNSRTPNGQSQQGSFSKERFDDPIQHNTLGFRPTCSCDQKGSGRCVVLDCFGGAGTSAVVAEELGRSWIMIDINPEYKAMALKRLQTTIGMAL